MITMNGLHRVQAVPTIASKHWRKLLPLYGIDLVGVLLFLAGYWWLAQRIVEVLLAINQLAPALRPPIDPAVMAQFSASYSMLLKLGLVLIAWVFVVWCLGFGFTLWKTYQLLRKHPPSLAVFLQRFATVSALTFVLAFLISWGYVQAGAWASAQTFSPLAPVLNVLFVLLLLSLLYILFCALQALDSDLRGMWQKTLVVARQWRMQLFPFALLCALSIGALWLLVHANLTLTIIVLLVGLFIPSSARLLVAMSAQ